MLRSALRLAWVLTRLGLILLLAVGAGAGAFWMAVEHDFREAEVEVPDVMGLSVGEATEKLAQSDLVLVVEARRANDQVGSGRIFYQEPLPGAGTRRQRLVRVVLSLGADRAPIPDLAGQSPRQVLLELGGGPIGLGRVFRVHTPRAPAGRILAQSPAAGIGTSAAEQIDVLVSLGTEPQRYVMPDLRGRPIALVESTLATGGIRIAEVRQEVIPGVPGGTVHAQHPLPGTRIGADTPVSLVVSRLVEVPVRTVAPRARFEVR